MSREEFIGNSRRNLVLKTAGIIRVLVGDKYYDINFRDNNQDNEQDKTNSTESDFIIANNINVYKNGLVEYPDDGKIIFTLTGDIYYVKNGEFHKYGLSETKSVSNTTSSIFDETVKFEATVPFELRDNNMIQNLNAQYLNGKTDEDFILKDANIKLRNLIIDSISSSDGVFSYKNGVLTIPESYFVLKNISESVKIGGFEVKGFEEIKYSKLLPYENTLIDDIIEYVSDDDFDYSTISNMVNIINSSNIDLSSLNKYNSDIQLEKLKQVKEFLFAEPKSGLFNDIKNNISDINLLPYHKASYILTVDSTSGVNVYDKFKAYITKERYIDSVGNYTYNSCNGTYYDNQLIEVNCIVTKVSNNKISITTDYESKIYKYQELNKRNIDFCDSEVTIEESSLPYSESDNYNEYICLGDEYMFDIDLSIGNIIGLLNGQTVNGEELSGYGLLLRDNGYFLNSKIYTSRINDSNIEESTIIDSTIKKCDIIESDITNSDIKNSDCTTININNSNINNTDIEDCDCSSLDISNSNISASDITECNIYNSVKYIELRSNQDYYIEENVPGVYSFKSNGGRVILRDSNVNGIVIDIYAVDDLIMRISGVDLKVSARTYYSYKNIPVGANNYKWVNIK